MKLLHCAQLELICKVAVVEMPATGMSLAARLGASPALLHTQTILILSMLQLTLQLRGVNLNI